MKHTQVKLTGVGVGLEPRAAGGEEAFPGNLGIQDKRVRLQKEKWAGTGIASAPYQI